MTMLVRFEGNIGAGKTSLATRFAETVGKVLHVEHFKEPVDAWRDFHGSNVLNMYYKDRRRWGFMFQCVALMDMYDIEKQATRMCEEAVSRSEPVVVVMERSTFSVTHVFNRVLHEQSCITLPEYHAVCGLVSIMDSPLSHSEHVINVYVRASPELCYARLVARSRPEELGRVPMEYLCKLHDLHEKACKDERLFPNALVVENDGESSVEQIVDSLLKRIQQRKPSVLLQ